MQKVWYSLNPRKPNFSMKEGKLLGHIYYKDGRRIDLDRVKEILKVEIPRNKREIQSFIGQVNFLRRFIPSFAYILRNPTNMLRKYYESNGPLRPRSLLMTSRK